MFLLTKNRVYTFVLGGLLPLVAIIYGLTGAFIGLYHLGEGAFSYAWPAAEGHVTTSAAYDRGWVTKMNVSYDYCVGRRCYTSQAIDFRGIKFTNDLFYINGVLDRYPYRMPVKVYYNPRRPSHAVLEPGIKLEYLSNVYTGAGVALIGVIGWLFATFGMAQFLFRRVRTRFA